MSCCPSIQASAAIGGAFTDANGPESDIRAGETVECFMARAGNTTGLQDDGTGNVLNKIDNTSIPITRSTGTVSTDVTFKLTVDSTTVAGSWSAAPIPPGLTFETKTVDGVLLGWLHGVFDSSALGNVYQIQVSVSDGVNPPFDTRGFTVAPTASNVDNEIRLIHPLPGAIVNSKFGPRMHPIYHVMKAHTGIDLKYQDRSTSDVIAAGDGEVVLCGGNPSSGYGLRVWIKHTTSAGAQLCTTTYNHLAKIYVTQGQKVMAGQKIGYEGSTGASTGNHLHFEVKLPDGKFVDPVPYISGTLVVADKTLSNGDADASHLSTSTGTASLSAAEVQARQASCTAFGPSYPQAQPPETTDSVPTVPNTDPFARAWYFIMTHEVGLFWTAAYPSDPEVQAGLINTPEQRKKVGYVNTPNYPGGETKFGIAQKPNPRMQVRTMIYDDARLTGFNNYWKSNRMPCVDKSERVAIMLMDMNYLHGDGNSKKIFQNSGITSSASDSDSTQLAHVQLLYEARVAFIKGIPRPEFQKGWLNRAADCLTYVQSF